MIATVEITAKKTAKTSATSTWFILGEVRWCGTASSPSAKQGGGHSIHGSFFLTAVLWQEGCALLAIVDGSGAVARDWVSQQGCAV